MLVSTSTLYIASQVDFKIVKRFLEAAAARVWIEDADFAFLERLLIAVRGIVTGLP